MFAIPRYHEKIFSAKGHPGKKQLFAGAATVTPSPKGIVDCANCVNWEVNALSIEEWRFYELFLEISLKNKKGLAFT